MEDGTDFYYISEYDILFYRPLIEDDEDEEFQTFLDELPEEDRYLFGTHYSCPGYVIGFLVR